MIRPTRRVLTAALAAVLLFPLLVIVEQAIQHGYSPARQAISELALGKEGWLQAVAFCSLAFGTYVLAVLIREVTHARAATALLTVAATFTLLSAFIRADPSSAKDTSVHGAVHQAMGILTFVCIVAAMFLLTRPLRADPQWKTFGLGTLVWASICVPIFFLPPVLGDGRFGIAQRVLVGMLISWIAATLLFARQRAVVGTTPSPLALPRGAGQ
jgi:Protein of unknown function (DUF998)